MKVLFIGCVQSSSILLNELFKIQGVTVSGIVSKTSSEMNADFESLIPIAIEKNIPYFDYSLSRNLLSWIKDHPADYLFCFGWSHLLQQEILALFPKRAVGFHPTALPKNRGRHPIIWSLALGLKETGSTFFYMDGGADTGDIISQKIIPIDYVDDASSLYEKILHSARAQVKEFSSEMLKGPVYGKPQDEMLANVWRKRTSDDGKIDWNASSLTIYNLVRALRPPYRGAHASWKGKNHTVWRAEEGENLYSDKKAGFVIASNNDGSFLVKCGQGTVKIIEHAFDPLPKEGEYL